MKKKLGELSCLIWLVSLPCSTQDFDLLLPPSHYPSLSATTTQTKHISPVNKHKYTRIRTTSATSIMTHILSTAIFAVRPSLRSLRPSKTQWKYPRTNAEACTLWHATTMLSPVLSVVVSRMTSVRRLHGRHLWNVWHLPTRRKLNHLSVQQQGYKLRFAATTSHLDSARPVRRRCACSWETGRLHGPYCPHAQGTIHKTREIARMEEAGARSSYWINYKMSRYKMSRYNYIYWQVT